MLKVNIFAAPLGEHIRCSAWRKKSLTNRLRQIHPVATDELALLFLVGCEQPRLRCHGNSFLFPLVYAGLIGRIFLAAPADTNYRV